MESFNEENSINEQKNMKTKQVKKIKQVIKKLLKKFINNKISKKSQKIEDEISEETNDNNVNELLEKRLKQQNCIEEQQNILNQQHFHQQIVFVENENGHFFWSTINNKFLPVDRELVEAKNCDTFNQLPQVQQILF